MKVNKKKFAIFHNTNRLVGKNIDFMISEQDGFVTAVDVLL
jgi:hypothetical protein